jgi:hypothetical protein
LDRELETVDHVDEARRNLTPFEGPQGYAGADVFIRFMRPAFEADRLAPTECGDPVTGAAISDSVNEGARSPTPKATL